MADVAALSLAVDSGQVVTATSALQELNSEAARSPSQLSRFKAATDELVAALNRNTSATDQLTTKMQGVQSASDRAADSVNKVGQATRTATTNVVDFAAAAAKARGEVDATAAAADKMAAAWARLGAAGAAVSKNLTPQGMAEFRLSNLSSNGTASSVGGQSQQSTASAATLGSPQSSAAQRDQILNYILLQGKDAFEQVLAGGSIGRALAIQAPQVVSLAAMGGLGAGDVVSGIGSKLTGLAEGAVGAATKLGLVGTAAATFGSALAVAVTAQQSYSAQQLQVARNVAGFGRTSGATQQSINDLAEQGGGNLSVRERRSYAGELASSGVNSQLFGGILGSLKDYAATTGQETSEALSSLASAFADPTKGAEMLNKQTGFLNATTRENIERLQAQGDKLGAGRALLTAYGESLTKASELTSGWAHATEAAGNIISNAWDYVGRTVDRAVTGGTLDQKLADAKTALQMAKDAEARGGLGSFLSPVNVSDQQKLVDDLQKQTDKRDKDIADKQRGQRSLAVDDIVRSVNPASEQLKRAEDSAKNIRAALAEGKVDPSGDVMRTLQGFELSAKRIKEDLAAGGSEMARSLRDAQFENRQVGAVGLGKTAAQINNEFAERQRGIEAANRDPNVRNEALQNLELERVTRLQTARQESALNDNQTGGAFSRMSAQVQQMIQDAAVQFPKIPQAIIAAIAEKEGGGKITTGQTTILGPDGRPASSAYGIGQITRDTARDAVRNGYLPPDFDRANQSTGVAGIGGVLTMKLDAAKGDLDKAIQNYLGSPDKSENQKYAADIYRRAGQMGDVTERGQAVAQDERQRSLAAEKQSLQANNEYLGNNAQKLDEVTRYNVALNAEMAKGTVITPEFARGLRAFTDGMSASTRSLADLRANRELDFSREQLGRDGDEQRVYAQARGIYGDTNNPQASAYMDKSRDLNDLTQAKQMVTDGATTFVSALRRGASASEALSQAFGNAADKLLSKALDSIVSSGFGALTGSGGSGLNFGDVGGWLGGAKSFIGFSGGGYTGDGGRYDPAGLVHRGEVVFSQADVARFGGAAVVERMRLGFPGYAEGGVVGGGGAAAAAGPAGMTNIQVNMQGSSGDSAKDRDHVDNTVKQLRAEMESVYKQQEARSLGTNGALWKAGVRRSSAG